MSNPLVHCESPDRPNLRLSVVEAKYVEIDKVIRSVLDSDNNERLLVFCRTINEVSSLYSDIVDNIDAVQMDRIQMFHSLTPSSIKEKIRQDMSSFDGSIKVLIATNAAGMGVNYVGVHRLINFGPPKDMNTFVQQIGRAGRDGLQSEAVLVYSNRQLCYVDEEMRGYVKNEAKCRREVISEAFTSSVQSVIQKHLCCDICEQFCGCDPSCTFKSFLHVTQDTDHSLDMRERFVSQDMKVTLRDHLKDLQMDLNSSVTVSLLSPTVSHGFSDQLVTDIVDDAENIFCLDFLMDNFPIWSLVNAVEILRVFDNLFGDIDLPDDELLFDDFDL